MPKYMNIAEFRFALFANSDSTPMIITKFEVTTPDAMSPCIESSDFSDLLSGGVDSEATDASDMTTPSANFTVVEEFTCNYTLTNGCNGYEVKNFTQSPDGIKSIVNEQGSVVSKKTFSLDDVSRMCIEFNYNIYSELNDDDVNLFAIFGMTKQGLRLYPQSDSKMNARGSKLNASIVT